ncbi:MAG TPA: fibronectin type III domain-containing protein, partial [Candidatus Obscuribacterales bacterium]
MFKLSQHSPSHISAKPARLLQALLAISLGLGLSACGPAPTSQTGPSASPSASPPTSASPSPQASSTPAMSALLKVHLQADPSLAGFATAAESFSLCLGQIASVSTQIKQNGGSETSESQPLTLAQLLKGIDLEFPVALVGVNEGRSTFFDAQGHELGFVSWQATVAEGGGTVSILLKANADTHAGEACPRLEASVTGATILGAGGNVINPIPLPNPVTTPTPGPTPTPAPSANAPALPTGLAVVEQTSSSLTLQWEFGTGPMSYNLYRDGQLVQGNYVSPNYYRFEGLNASTQYTLGVQAVNSGGASPIASLSSTTLSSGHSGSGSFSGGGSDSTHNDDTSSGTLTASREFDINTFTSARQENSRVATDNTGHFVVAWQSGQGVDGSGAGIRGRLYSGAKAQGPEFQINTYTSNDQISPDVAMRGNGSFVVVWQDQVQEGNFGIYGQRFDPDGEPVGSEFHINSYTSFNQTEPKIALDDAGNFVVVWKSVLNDFSGDGVAGQLFDSNGNRIGSEFQVNSYTTAEQFS